MEKGRIKMIYIYMTIMSFGFMYAYNFFDRLMIDKVFRSTLYLVLEKLSFLLSFIVVCVPGMIRYNVGIDYTTYTNYQIPVVLAGEAGKIVKVEPFYQAVVWIGYWLGKQSSYQWIFAITNFIIIFFYLSI